MTFMFGRVFTPQNKTFSNQNKGPHLGTRYNLGLPPTQLQSPPGLLHFLARESQPKPSFATGILGGG